MHVTVEGF